MKRLLLLFIAFFPLYSSATHIVGGEIVLKHESQESYRLALILYFDEVYGNPGAIDPNADIHIFSKENNSYIQSFTLPIQSDTYVEYTNPDCATGDLITRRIYYEVFIELSGDTFNEPRGYYLTYERCCRNQVIQNIIDPGGAGQTFYLEVPPVVLDGQLFINSTPELFPPLSDYACINQPFYFDFGGTDADGDSLVYSVSVPLNGNSTRDNPLPAAIAGPYSSVVFREGYSVRNLIRGNPSLNIDASTGFLTITPSELGLFVFAIKCEEYREGRKIGEVRRDYQMLVLDCPVANPPEIGLRSENDTISQEFGEFTFNAEQVGNCFKIYARDPNPLSVLSPRVIPLNAQSNNLLIVSPTSTSVSGENQIIEFEACLTECPNAVNTTLEFLLLVADNSCSLPLQDTTRVSIEVLLENTPPTVSTDLPFNSRNNYYEIDLEVGMPLNFEALGLDADVDSLVLRGLGGLNFPILTGRGSVSQEVEWIPTCDLLPAGDTSAVVFLDLILEDYWECGKKSSDTTQVKVNLFYNPEENPLPEVEITSLTPVEEGNTIRYVEEIVVGDSVIIDLQAIDPNGDFITIEAQGVELLEQKAGAFSGASPLNLQYVFNSSCEQLGENATPGEYLITFVAKDESNCSPNAQDVVELLIRVIDEPQPQTANFPNAFSPNGDTIGDTFKIGNLPIDNCQDEFESIHIYNRWGEEVFVSKVRNFEWTGESHPAGIYFYLIKYVNSEYKGTVSLITSKSP